MASSTSADESAASMLNGLFSAVSRLNRRREAVVNQIVSTLPTVTSTITEAERVIHKLIVIIKNPDNNGAMVLYSRADTIKKSGRFYIPIVVIGPPETGTPDNGIHIPPEGPFHIILRYTLRSDRAERKARQVKTKAKWYQVSISVSEFSVNLESTSSDHDVCPKRWRGQAYRFGGTIVLVDHCTLVLRFMVGDLANQMDPDDPRPLYLVSIQEVNSYAEV